MTVEVLPVAAPQAPMSTTAREPASFHERSAAWQANGAARDRAVRRRMNPHELTRELEELIAALDRRVPRVEQAGEATIARDAAALRAKAVDRLAELASHLAVPIAHDRGDSR